MTTHPFFRRNKPPLREVDRIGKIDVGACRAILEHVIPLLAQEPCPPCEGTGIVMVAGGRYLREAYASVRKTREVTELPVQIWHLGNGEVTIQDRRNFEDLEVTFVNSYDFLDEHPSYQMSGWPAKPYSVAYCPFRHVLLLDADAYPVVDPEEVFQSDAYKQTGALMWPDTNQCRKGDMVFPCMGIKRPEDFREMEVGQLLIDKQRLWKSVRLTVFMNSHSECFYKLLFGDKDLWQMALRKLDVPFSVGDDPTWMGWGMRHVLNGKPVFHHFMEGKRRGLYPDDVRELLKEYDQLNQLTHA